MSGGQNFDHGEIANECATHDLIRETARNRSPFDFESFGGNLDRYPCLFTRMERVLCPRVHFKCVIIDGRLAYFGSANLTGAWGAPVHPLQQQSEGEKGLKTEVNGPNPFRFCSP